MGAKWLDELWDKEELLVCCKKHSHGHSLFLGITSAGAELPVQGWGLPILPHWGCNGSQAMQLTRASPRDVLFPSVLALAFLKAPRNLLDVFY